jgi:hypothetical protein
MRRLNNDGILDHAGVIVGVVLAIAVALILGALYLGLAR